MADAPAAPPDLLTAHAAARPDKVALIEDAPGAPVAAWTFVELEAWANRFAAAVRSLGVGAGERVVWCGPNSASVIALVHGCRKAGVTAVPLNYRLTVDEAGYVLDNCDAVAAWVDAEYAPLIVGARGAAPGLRTVISYRGTAAGCDDGDALVAGCDDGPAVAGAAGDGPAVAGAVGAPGSAQAGTVGSPGGTVVPGSGATPGGTMIYTSGTTGRPKGAVRAATGDPAQVRSLVDLIGYTPEDVYLTTGPLYHSGPGGFAAIAAALGNTVVVQRRFDPEDWLRLVDAHRVTTTFSAPTPIRMVCALDAEARGRYDTSSMRRMIANAAPWSMALKRQYLTSFPPDSLWEVYGSTELGVDTVLAPSDHLRKPGSCGLAAPGVEIRLLDDDGAEVTEPGAPGELFVRSASMFRTYHKAADKYDEDRRGDFHTVGDIAYRDADGYFYICDRKKDMIISGGMNIYPAEIEAALEAHPDIYEAAAFGVPSEEWGEAVHAVVIVRPGASLDAAGVSAFAREHLAGYKVPRSVSFTDELPKTGSGKVLKRVLREPFWAGRSSQVG